MKKLSVTTAKRANHPGDAQLMSLSRRSFLRSAGLAVGALALSGLAGCGTGESENSQEKVLKFAQANAKRGLDLQKSVDSKSISVSDPVVEALLVWNDDLELQPLLITEMPKLDDDGVTYHFTLKEGVKFHDGTTLTADDVKFTFERMFLPETAGKSVSTYDMIKGAKDIEAGKTTEITGIVIEDDTHFTIMLDYPMGTFVKNLGNSFAGIFPRKACTDADQSWGTGTNFVGTGSYKLTENDDSTKLVYERFDDYHNGRPKLDCLEISYIDDVNTQMMSFKNGDIDLCDLDPTLLAQYKDDSEVKDYINTYTPLGTQFLTPNLKVPEFQDVRVRKALSLAINRQELIDTILSGAGIIPSGFINPKVPGYDPNAEPFEYNVDKAKDLMKQAGNLSINLACSVRSTGNYQKCMVAIQNYWEQIGVHISVNVVDSGVWINDWVAGNLNIMCGAWYPLYPDGDNALYANFFSENSVKKSSFYNNPTFDDLLTRGRRSHDDAERTELYRQADDILTRQDYAAIPLFYPKYQFVARPWVQNMKIGNIIYHFNSVDIDNSKRS